MNKETRVRYSRLENSRTPKNTLVTIVENNTIFFGISRCNRKMDVFYKEIGTFIAKERADFVMSNYQQKRYCKLNGTEIFLHDSGLRGSVPLNNIKELVNYFKGVDEYCLNSLAPRTVEV